jgi:hypothetical protein
MWRAPQGRSGGTASLARQQDQDLGQLGLEGTQSRTYCRLSLSHIFSTVTNALVPLSRDKAIFDHYIE